MKGEYQGKDGRTYHVQGIGVKTEPYSMTPFDEATGDSTLYPNHPDYAAAKAALDELVSEGEEESGGRVDWSAPNGRWYRALEDGGEVEMLVDDRWCEANGSAIAAYRAGLQVRDEAVRELKEAAEELSGGPYPGPDRVCVAMEVLKRIREAAGRVKL